MTEGKEGKIEELSRLLTEWLDQHPMVFAYSQEERAWNVVEVASGKERRLRADEISRWRVATDSQGGGTYLNLELDGGPQLVLADQGFVFAPDFRNTGPIALPSSVFCTKDLKYMLSMVHTGLAEPTQETVGLLMAAIAVIDGGQAVGLNMDREAREADALLNMLETRGGGA